MVRWLDPHPDSLLRDYQNRPICTYPFNSNHALWIFSKSKRPDLDREIIYRNLRSFPGDDDETRLAYSRLESSARFDLLQPACFDTFVNCTLINEDSDAILETITLPFE